MKRIKSYTTLQQEYMTYRKKWSKVILKKVLKIVFITAIVIATIPFTIWLTNDACPYILTDWFNNSKLGCFAASELAVLVALCLFSLICYGICYAILGIINWYRTEKLNFRIMGILDKNEYRDYKEMPSLNTIKRIETEKDKQNAYEAHRLDEITNILTKLRYDGISEADFRRCNLPKNADCWYGIKHSYMLNTADLLCEYEHTLTIQNNLEDLINKKISATSRTERESV